MAELDALARKLQQLCETERDPHWEIKHPSFDGLDVWGELGGLEGVDWNRIRRFVLWVGSPVDDRRITVQVTTPGVQVDVWSEDAERSREMAAIVGSRVRDLRPWWAFLRSFAGTLVLCYLLSALAFVPFFVAGWPITFPTGLAVAVIGAVGGVVASWFAAPVLRIGGRLHAGALVGRLAIWLFGAVGAGFLGVFIDRLV